MCFSEVLLVLVIPNIILGQIQCEYPVTNVENFHYTPFTNSSGYLALVGDVNDVLQGIITTETNDTIWTHQTTGGFGFGAAAVGPLEGIGEGIFVNGIAFVRQTNSESENYFQTIYGKEFRTPFSLFVSNVSLPDGYVQFVSRSNSENISMNNFYERLYQDAGRQPFCFYGLTEFVQLEAIAISKAPIYMEPIFGNTNYYTEPNFQLTNEYGLTFGCAANFSNIQDSELMATLMKVFYVNPLDIGSMGELQVHSHVLSLSKCLQSPADIDASTARDVYHMLSNATISYISAQVYTLTSIDKIVELTPKNDAQNICSIRVHWYFVMWIYVLAFR